MKRRTEEDKDCKICENTLKTINLFLNTQASLAPNHVTPSVSSKLRHIFKFPFCQRLWSLYVKSWRNRTQIICPFWVWVGWGVVVEKTKVYRYKYFEPEHFWPKAYPAQTFLNGAYPAVCTSSELIIKSHIKVETMICQIWLCLCSSMLRLSRNPVFCTYILHIIIAWKQKLDFNGSLSDPL